MLNQDEFKIHFLGMGQGQPEENLLKDKLGNEDVSLGDFNFIQMIGIGGFSKVYLVQKRGTDELYALKSIRLPDNR